MTASRILLVDDEEPIRQFLRLALAGHGYQILEAANGAEAVAMVKADEPDAVVLDMGLPDVSGLDVTRTLRSWTWVPIVFLSVHDEERIKVEALDAGADDYLTKPFSLPELLARLRAALRRRTAIPPEGVLVREPLRLDPQRRLVTLGGQRLSLTPTEFSVLRVLMLHWDKVVSHRHLLGEVWGPAYQDETQILRVNISNLRKKLDSVGGADYLFTEPGVGYRLGPLE